MKINRLIIVLCIIGSGVFVSFYGGNISYALFYSTIFLPVICFLYTLYVYFRFKLFQSMGSYLVVKGDWTLYFFIIANEDVVTFRNVKVNFLTDKSTIEAAGQSVQYSLLPGESDRMDTRIKCNYRGEYYVGVNSIEITDFLYLFTITYPVRSKIKVIVLPRVVPIERLAIAPPEIDVKNPMHYSNTSEEELSSEMQRYNRGDGIKRIHWKATARQRQLMSRKYYQKPKNQIVLFMDLMKMNEDELQVTIYEDKIIESILAIANFYAMRGTPSQIIYEMNGKKQISISGKEEFNAFYKTCAAIQFTSKIPVNDLIHERMLRGDEGIFYMVVTHYLTKEIYLSALKLSAEGNHIGILFISDDVSEKTKELVEGFKLAGIEVYRNMSGDEIADVLLK